MRSRHYGLFRRPRNAPKGTQWELVSQTLLPRERAIRFWQNILLSAALNPDQPEYRLRPITNEVKSYWCVTCEDYRVHNMHTEEKGTCGTCHNTNFAPMGDI